MAPARLRLVALISGRGSNLAAIARACRAGVINAEVAAVIADRADAGGLALAAAAGIATCTVPYRQYRERAAFEQALREAIDAYSPQLVVLAGFMRILSPEFTAHYMGRMLNIHPALLPRHKGLHTHRRALAAGEAEHGASVHFVTAELDGGPVVLQARVPIRADDDEARLSARVQLCEHIIYPRVIGWIASGRLTWSAGAPVLDGVPLSAPLTEDCTMEKPGEAVAR